jgi:hypothetical protein
MRLVVVVVVAAAAVAVFTIHSTLPTIITVYYGQ